ncbi:probable HAT2-subunit of the major yeast histone acetyltransferase [Rhynchosporium secalis]|uniref:Probable HAT2-subunit of the major yeast histone acetyltransferase n=1 Tax=Rhynchosporium secalis TaxID=38038 RepID=A0A1E1MKC4_RHYSE|nr:probable HAT2-subunit of the major yeast histone acetyltransferase [Rhynchosporium secalis]
MAQDQGDDMDLENDGPRVDVEDGDTEQKIINEEYKTWKKNSPFLYDMILSTALEWPTLTTQWFPDKKEPKDKNYTIHRLLIGTHTSNDAQNFLQIANVEIPKMITPNPHDYDEHKGEIGGYGNSSNGEQAAIKMTIEQKIDHPGEVNKARYQPQNPNIIATMAPGGRVLIFDRTKHSSAPNGVVSPQAELVGHKSEGFGLCWSPHEAGRLATGSEDKTVRLWDLKTISSNNTNIKASRIYTHHKAVVNDVQYHPLHKSLIGTVSDDCTLQILDVRQGNLKDAAVMCDAHSDAVNALAFNHASEFVLATASADKTIGIWDLRNLKDKLHSLEGHGDAVTSLAWHPHEEAILGSGGYDRRVIFWDLSRVGEEQSQDDQEDGPPELLFMHGGHTNHLSDFSWNVNEPWVVCSAAEDNLIQIWKVAEAIVGRDIGDDVPVNEMQG